MDYFLDMPFAFSLYKKAKVVLLPVPYDGTSTFVKGSDKGPQAIIDASDSIELYDVEEDMEIYRYGIHTAEPVRETSSPDKMVDAVYRRVKSCLEDNKLLGLLGGEHSVSCGAIRAFSEKYSNLTVLQLDAHADLRDEYQGSIYNHACVMRRAQDFVPVVQVGIRSVCLEEKKYVVEENMFYAHCIRFSKTWMQEAINRLTENVYLTIDLDCFDPSVVPSTGTPLAGGLSWWQVLDFISEVNKERNIVGFDIVELCPNPLDKSSDVLAATLVYKIVTKILKKRINHGL
ncbi:MAG: agmatinase [Bacteroidales bacterium]|jgi:agmatinase|nr:agmatinase [Bacteroidales bacterium]